MVDLLQELVKRKDYKLTIIWNCKECGKEGHVLLHRTKEEAECGDRNIKQKCWDGHISIPFKRCTKCGNTYTINDFDCKVCDIYVRERTLKELKEQGLLNAE